MKVVRAQITNFGSFKTLDFKFDSPGLALLSGPTGSGKSTVCDIIPWGLFGRTAKNGAADDVLRWDSNAPTVCHITLDSGHVITRVRSKGKNDLFFEVDGTLHRGRDMADTQQRINDLLQMSAELYLSGSYFHEFSQVAQFFTLTAKNRRDIIEQIADLDFVVTLQNNRKLSEKKLNTEVMLAKAELGKAEIYCNKAKIEVSKLHKNKSGWRARISSTIAALQQKHDNFEKDKALKLSRLTNELNSITASSEILNQIKANIAELEYEVSCAKGARCETCGGPTEHAHVGALELRCSELVKNLYDCQAQITRRDTIIDKIAAETATVNNYQSQINHYKAETNPYGDLLKEAIKHYREWAGVFVEKEVLINSLCQQLVDHEVLDHIIDAHRAYKVSVAINTLLRLTNNYLTEYFDAEIKVLFSLASSDKLEVSITKDGNHCSFAQLSKGQRQLLKLCFGVAVMQTVANHNGLDFKQLFFDEALDGLDDTLKSKAFNLLQKLSTQYDQIYVVEHSQAFKSLFDTTYAVTLVNGESVIEKT